MYPRIENGRALKNVECTHCHKNVDKGEGVQWQGESMDLLVKISFKNRKCKDKW